MTNQQCLREFEFSLILSGITELTDEVERAIFDAGCDDATLSIQYGAARLEFARMAPDMTEAILSAIQNVCQAGFGVIQVDDWPHRRR